METVNLGHFGNIRSLYKLHDVCVAVSGVIYVKEMSISYSIDSYSHNENSGTTLLQPI